MGENSSSAVWTRMALMCFTLFLFPHEPSQTFWIYVSKVIIRDLKYSLSEGDRDYPDIVACSLAISLNK